MSRFSTATDLFDVITAHKSFQEFRKRFPYIYIGHSDRPIKYRKLSDLVKYYPYVPFFIYSPNRTKGTIRLCESSYVDELEQSGEPQETISSLRNELKEEKERAKQRGYESTVRFTGWDRRVEQETG